MLHMHKPKALYFKSLNLSLILKLEVLPVSYSFYCLIILKEKRTST